LETKVRADVIIVGSGVIGLAAARELHRRGVKNISVLDKGAPGREASWAAAGILAPQVEADEADDFFRLCYESNKMYRLFADELRAETGVDIELDQTGTLYVGFDDEDSIEIERRFAWQTAAGMEVKHLDSRDTLEIEPRLAAQIRESLFFRRDGEVENRKLVAALLRYATLNGINIIENAEVHRVETDKGGVTGVVTKKGAHSAATVILAAGAWTSSVNLGAAVFPVAVRPVRGQMICYRPSSPVCDHVVYSRRGYLVPRADCRLLVGATAEDVGFDKSLTEAATREMQAVGAEIAPALSHVRIDDQWAGLRPYVSGGRPLIGRIPSVDGLFAAIGHFRNGILLTPITAKLIADAVTGNSNEFLDPFGFRDVKPHQISDHL